MTFDFSQVICLASCNFFSGSKTIVLHVLASHSQFNLFGLVSDIHGQYWTIPTNLAIKT